MSSKEITKEQLSKKLQELSEKKESYEKNYKEVKEENLIIINSYRKELRAVFVETKELLGEYLPPDKGMLSVPLELDDCAITITIYKGDTPDFIHLKGEEEEEEMLGSVDSTGRTPFGQVVYPFSDMELVTLMNKIPDCSVIVSACKEELIAYLEKEVSSQKKKLEYEQIVKAQLQGLSIKKGASNENS